MRDISETLEHIESVLKPIENTLNIMLAHKNIKPESKTKIVQNIQALHSLRNTLNTLQPNAILPPPHQSLK